MLKTNPKRLKESLISLAELAKTTAGINRLAYSKEFFKSCEYVAGKMREAGMTVITNSVGNVVGTYKGKTNRKIVIGSHIDSVPNGGMFDGCLGVMGAVEAVLTLYENNKTLNHSIDVASWAEEEGVVISGLLGSRAYCGLPLTQAHLEKLDEFKILKKDIEDCKVDEPLDYSIELHIEQGSILADQKMDIGVVTAIVAIKRYIITVDGFANHAGTTPMYMRDDALVKAAGFIKRVREVATEVDSKMVATVGHIEVEPNSVNVVPGKVVMSLELRAVNEESLYRAYKILTDEFKDVLSAIEPTMDQKVYTMDETVKQAVRDASGELGFTWCDMLSGAVHDSISLAEVTRPGMIFVPSIGGVSHSSKELTNWSDASNGADVLLNALIKLDER